MSEFAETPSRTPGADVEVTSDQASRGKEPDSLTSWVDLSAYSNPEYDPGRGLLFRTFWYFVSVLLFESGLFPVCGPKAWVLRRFGAKVGSGLVIKPHVRIKYPWRLEIGDHCWIGQNVWIDNLADVRIGNHVCVSQQVYICTGSHRISTSTFDLLTKPVTVGDGAWLAARSTILGGVVIGANAVAAAGSVVTETLAPAAIVSGNPASQISVRRAPQPHSDLLQKS